MVSVKSKKGFSLTELIVVMGIIALLAALGVGAMMLAKKSAKNTERSVSAQEVETALAAFAAKNHGKYVASVAGFDAVGNFAALVDYLIENKYLDERPKGLLAEDGNTAGSEDQHYFYMPYGGTGKNEHYVLAVCATEKNSYPDVIPWDPAQVPKKLHYASTPALPTVETTKEEIHNCKSANDIIYFVNK